jgi:hypothetical protein
MHRVRHTNASSAAVTLAVLQTQASTDPRPEANPLLVNSNV